MPTNKSKKESMAFFCDMGSPQTSSKSHSIAAYLDRINELGAEFDKLEAVSTAGDIRPLYPYQWRAKAKMIEGEDDASEGLGGSPLEAVRQLYKQIKSNSKYDESEEPND